MWQLSLWTIEVDKHSLFSVVATKGESSIQYVVFLLSPLVCQFKITFSSDVLLKLIDILPDFLNVMVNRHRFFIFEFHRALSSTMVSVPNLTPKIVKLPQKNYKKLKLKFRSKTKFTKELTQRRRTGWIFPTKLSFKRFF